MTGAGGGQGYDPKELWDRYLTDIHDIGVSSTIESSTLRAKLSKIGLTPGMPAWDNQLKSVESAYGKQKSSIETGLTPTLLRQHAESIYGRDNPDPRLRRTTVDAEFNLTGVGEVRDPVFATGNKLPPSAEAPAPRPSLDEFYAPDMADPKYKGLINQLTKSFGRKPEVWEFVIAKAYGLEAIKTQSVYTEPKEVVALREAKKAATGRPLSAIGFDEDSQYTQSPWL